MALSRRRWLLIGLAVVVLAGATFAYLWSRSGARPVTADEAARRIQGATTAATAPSELRPAAGVYRYVGSGTDRIDKPAKEQAEGPDMPATVTDEDGGCWRFRIDYSSNHWQSWRYCPRDGGLDESGGDTYQKWDFVVFSNESTTTFECDSSVTIRADQQPGDEWTQTCHDANAPGTISAGTYRFVGAETLRIGGDQVTALRYHRDRAMSGGQSGTESSDVWFAADTGLPVRNERKIDVKTSTVIGDVHYTEDARFELSSLTPTS